MPEPRGELDPDEVAALLPGVPAGLLGDRLAAIFAACGVPPCRGCHKRRAWLNNAHAVAWALFGLKPGQLEEVR